MIYSLAGAPDAILLAAQNSLPPGLWPDNSISFLPYADSTPAATPEVSA
jgi:hypothetical protein